MENSRANNAGHIFDGRVSVAPKICLYKRKKCMLFYFHFSFLCLLNVKKNNHEDYHSRFDVGFIEALRLHR